MARTAVVAGTATAVGNRVSRRQAQRWGAESNPTYRTDYADQAGQPSYQQSYQQAPPPPPPPAPGPSDGDNLSDELARLADLKAQGILSDAEFQAAKAKLLGT